MTTAEDLLDNLTPEQWQSCECAEVFLSRMGAAFEDTQKMLAGVYPSEAIAVGAMMGIAKAAFYFGTELTDAEYRRRYVSYLCASIELIQEYTNDKANKSDGSREGADIGVPEEGGVDRKHGPDGKPVH